MMIEFIPFEPVHLSKLPISDPGQIAWRHNMLQHTDLEVMAVEGRAWTGIEDGITVGCAGFITMWSGRVTSWAVFAGPSKKAWHRIYRKIRDEINFLHDEGVRRVEASVPTDFGQGCRLASVLGFKIEGQVRKYDIYGKDHFMYSHVIGDE